MTSDKEFYQRLNKICQEFYLLQFINAFLFVSDVWIFAAINNAFAHTVMLIHLPLVMIGATVIFWRAQKKMRQLQKEAHEFFLLEMKRLDETEGE